MIAEVGIAAIAVVTSVWLVGHTAVSIAKAKAEVEADLKLRREAQNNEFKLERIKAETAAMRADADITAFAANAGQARRWVLRVLSAQFSRIQRSSKNS